MSGSFMSPGVIQAPELVYLSGLTYRQIDHWTTLGLLRPVAQNPGSGQARLWPRTEADIARIMRRLCEAGIRPGVGARIAREARGGSAAAGALVAAVIAYTQTTERTEDV